MTKSELARKVAAACGITLARAAQAVDGVAEVITAALEEGDKVTIPGFGTFSTHVRSPRNGTNPATGAPMQIEAKRVASFKAGSVLRDRLGE